MNLRPPSPKRNRRGGWKAGRLGVKRIVFSGHAEMKFGILERHGFHIAKDVIVSAMESPDIVEAGYRSRKIAQKVIDDNHVIRVVYEDLPEEWRIVTFYPGRRRRYENQL
jgi:hypothetical protein